MPDIERCQLRVTGTVQGVGFRPFVYRQAIALGLAGFVRNDSAGVLIEVEGHTQAWLSWAGSWSRRLHPWPWLPP